MQTGAPNEIYDYPRNEFAADFIGETYFLPGKVMSANNSDVEVKLDNGPSIKYTSYYLLEIV